MFFYKLLGNKVTLGRPASPRGLPHLQGLRPPLPTERPQPTLAPSAPWGQPTVELETPGVFQSLGELSTEPGGSEGACPFPGPSSQQLREGGTFIW